MNYIRDIVSYISIKEKKIRINNMNKIQPNYYINYNNFIKYAI